MKTQITVDMATASNKTNKTFQEFLLRNIYKSNSKSMCTKRLLFRFVIVITSPTTHH